MDHLLEKQRQCHEDIERLEQAIVDQYHLVTKTHKDRLAREHQVGKYLDLMTERCTELHKLYMDEDGARRSAIESITGPNDYGSFYQQLASIQKHHSHSNSLIYNFDIVSNIQPINSSNLENLFSGEEQFGKYLDLHLSFLEYLNLKFDETCSYTEYLSKLNQLHHIPKKEKSSLKYKTYLENLITYLESYFQRAQPLSDYLKFKNEAISKFELDWPKGNVKGWSNLKDENLFCKVCNKSFANLNVFNGHLNGKKHLKLIQQNNNNNNNNEIQLNQDPNYQIGKLESILYGYFQPLLPIIEDTRSNVERKQSLTEKEREDEQELEEVEALESDDDDDERIYNPLRLPLGWDGKPIPYWLYKLHGLGVEYPCEICGNFVYMGRKAFERHFQEWRHAHGMKCLGIPNTKHFNEITSIPDAFSLWEKLKVSTRQEIQQEETLEEFEDDLGNVFNKKTFEDLKRQGLL